MTWAITKKRFYKVYRNAVFLCKNAIFQNRRLVGLSISFISLEICKQCIYAKKTYPETKLYKKT